MARISEWIKIVIYVFLREMSFIFRNRTFLFLLIILPIVLFSFFCLFYSKGILSDIPVAVYDADNSELSRGLTRSIESSSSMKIISNVTNLNALEKGINNGTFKAAFYFPKDMEKEVKKQHQVHPVFYKNSQNIVISNSLYKDAMLIFKSYNAGILLKKLKSTGMNENQGKCIIQPIVPDILYLYNPNYNYSNFLSPAYIFVLCQMIMVLCGMYSITHEIEYRKFACIIQEINRYPGALIIGKLLAVMIPFSLIVASVQLVLFPYFHIYIEGSGIITFVLIHLFLIASFLPGFAIGAVVKKSMLATEIIIFLNMPSLLVSGYTFPAVTGIFAVFAKVLPFTYFETVYFKIAQMNNPLITTSGEICAFSIFIITGFFISWVSLIRLNKSIEKKQVRHET